MDREADRSPPSAPELCAVLEDGDCREIIRQLNEPMTASELAANCEIPQSTLYRKLELLTETTLLEESTEIRRDGHHTSTYAIGFTEVRFALESDRTLTATVERPARTADERLAELWSEVSREI